MKSILGTKYPIMAAAMNQVSDANLAIAVSKAGALPSISVFNYFRSDNSFDILLLEEDIKKYTQETNNSLFVLSIDPTIIDDQLIRLIEKFKIEYIELIPMYSYLKNKELRKILFKNLSAIQNLGTKIILKVVAYPEDLKYWSAHEDFKIDFIGLKGPAGAGRVKGDISITDLIKQVSEETDIPIIAIGGIYNSAQVTELLDLGVAAVGIGTVLAASEESPLSVAAKLKLVNGTSREISKLQTVDLDQNTLVITPTEQSDLENNSIGLYHGVNTGVQGHIFAGSAIDGITKIDTVENIIKNLIS